jgi:hypothetical protein
LPWLHLSTSRSTKSSRRSARSGRSQNTGRPLDYSLLHHISCAERFVSFKVDPPILTLARCQISFGSLLNRLKWQLQQGRRLSLPTHFAVDLCVLHIAFRPYAFKAEETGVYITEQVHFISYIRLCRSYAVNPMPSWLQHAAPHRFTSTRHKNVVAHWHTSDVELAPSMRLRAIDRRLVLIVAVGILYAESTRTTRWICAGALALPRKSFV